MAEDDVAPEKLFAAIERVNSMKWKEARYKALVRALDIIAGLLHYEIVKIEKPIKKEKPYGKQ